MFPQGYNGTKIFERQNDDKLRTGKLLLIEINNKKTMLYKEAYKKFIIPSGLKVAVLSLIFEPKTDYLRKGQYPLDKAPLLLDQGADIYGYVPFRSGQL